MDRPRLLFELCPELWSYRNFQRDVTAWIGWQISHHGHPLLTRQKRCFYKGQLLTRARIFVLI